jgi:hypothetical protein
MTKRRVLTVLAAIAIGAPSSIAAQLRRQPAGAEKPKVDIVQSIGCAERRNGGPETWWLGRASDPRATAPGVFTVKQVEEARGAALGTNLFQLAGVADFLDTEGLLRTGRRAEFTSAETANASGQLQPGRKVLVKGLLVEVDGQKRINLISVISLADRCE